MTPTDQGTLPPGATQQALRSLIERCQAYLAEWPEADQELARRIDQLHVELIDDPRGQPCH